MKCLRPDCENNLHTGKKYCSTKCSAMDRSRVKAEFSSDIAVAMREELGESADFVLSEVHRYLAEDIVSPNVMAPKREVTYGDWVLSYDGTKDYRPGDDLSFDKIEMMLKSGPVMFAMMMKIAPITRVFSEGRFKVVSPDTELADVADAALRTIMPKMAQDLCYAMFVYGAAFMEERWEWKEKYQLGLSDQAGGDKFLVPKVPNSVNPKTVGYIRRTKKGDFDGFAQQKQTVANVIGIADGEALDGMFNQVYRDAALVIPLNEHFRNLWGESFLKALYPIWVWYEITLRTMARYMERMATPVVRGKAPMRGMITIEGRQTPVRAMDLILSVAGNVAKSNAVAIPSDRDPETKEPLFELDYMTSDERGQEFIRVLEFLGQEMIKAALNADRSLTQSSGGVGSYNIGEIHQQASSLTSLMISLQILYYLNQYFMPDFSRWNRGENGPPIWLKIQSIDTQERDLLMQLLGIIGNTPGGQEASDMFDWRTIAETSNIPVLDENEVKSKQDERHQDAMTRQEDQMKIASKFQAKAPDGSTFKNQPGKGSDGQEPKKAEEVKIPWVLGEHEAEILYQAGVLDEGVYQLFNPFHDGSTGRFASRQGGGTSFVEPDSPDTLQGAANQARKKGGFVKTTGKVLGLTGLGIVGFAVLGSAMSGNDKNRMQEIKEEEIAVTEKKLAELIKNWPKFNSEEEAVSYALNNLEIFGLTSIPNIDVRIEDFGRNRAAAFWSAGDNTVVIKPEFARDIFNGDPVAMAVLVHEIAHSNQEFVGDTGEDWGNVSEVDRDSNFGENWGKLMEGQNDLVTQMVLSDMYGQPMGQYKSAEMHNEYETLSGHLGSVKNTPDGVLVTSVSKTGGLRSIGYPDEAAVWATIAIEGSKKTGETPKQFLARTHDFGFSANELHQVLVDVFPEEMSSNGYYNNNNGSIYRKYPTQSELRLWMDDHGYISPDLALDQLLKEAAQ